MEGSNSGLARFNQLQQENQNCLTNAVTSISLGFYLPFEVKPMPPSFSFIYYFLGKICYPNKSHIPWKYSLQVSSFFIVSYFQYSWQSSGYEAHSVGWAWSRIVIMQADPCFKLGSHSNNPSLPYCTFLLKIQNHTNKKLGSKTYYFTPLLWFCKVVKILGW